MWLTGLCPGGDVPTFRTQCAGTTTTDGGESPVRKPFRTNTPASSARFGASSKTSPQSVGTSSKTASRTSSTNTEARRTSGRTRTMVTSPAKSLTRRDHGQCPASREECGNMKCSRTRGPRARSAAHATDKRRSARTPIRVIHKRLIPAAPSSVPS
jgi:hypothetical protein